MARPAFLFISLDTAGLKAGTEWQAVWHALGPLREAKLIDCQYGCIEDIGALGALLRAHEAAVLHIVGHGESRALHIKGKNGDLMSLDGHQLARMVSAFKRRPSLVYLNACHSLSMSDDLLGVADVVIAYDGPVNDEYASAIASDFYGALARHETPEASLAIACSFHRNLLQIGRQEPTLVGRGGQPLFPTVRSIEVESEVRQLSSKELQTAEWQRRLTDFVDEHFSHGSFNRPYKLGQVAGWIKTYEDAYIVLVARTAGGEGPLSEKIVGCVKVLPLREDCIAMKPFDPFEIAGEDLVSDERKAKAIWVGDLVSSGHELIALLLALRFKLERAVGPIYCRTELAALRRILFERYGARVLRPSGRDADGDTILIVEPEARLDQKVHAGRSWASSDTELGK